MHDGYQSLALSSRLGIPMIYGVDAVHGHNNVFGATIFPHNIGLGATRNPELVGDIGQITARRSPPPGSPGASRPASAWCAMSAGVGPTSPSGKTPRSPP